MEENKQVMEETTAEQTQMEMPQSNSEIDFNDPRIEEYVQNRMIEEKRLKEEAEARAKEEAERRELLESLSKEEKEKFEKVSQEDKTRIEELLRKTQELNSTLIEKEKAEIMLDKGIDKRFKPFINGSTKEELVNSADLFLQTLNERDKEIEQRKYNNVSAPKVYSTSTNGAETGRKLFRMSQVGR